MPQLLHAAFRISSPSLLCHCMWKLFFEVGGVGDRTKISLLRNCFSMFLEVGGSDLIYRSLHSVQSFLGSLCGDVQGLATLDQHSHSEIISSVKASPSDECLSESPKFSTLGRTTF